MPSFKVDKLYSLLVTNESWDEPPPKPKEPKPKLVALTSEIPKSTNRRLKKEAQESSSLREESGLNFVKVKGDKMAGPAAAGSEVHSND